MHVLSVVVPVYFNELNLPETIPQLLRLSDSFPGYHLELVFVDDGSGDGSLSILLDFQSRHPDHIRVVKLTRNFGSMAAIQAGFATATGDCVGMISADLQDPPELLVEMVRHWEAGTKAILAVRQDREEPLSQKIVTGLFYTLIRRIALQGFPPGGFDFFLVDRQVADEINRIHEKNTNLMALIFWLGFQPVLIPYVRLSRKQGTSRWTFMKKLKHSLDTLVAFSYFPIQMISIVGFLIAAGSFLYGTFILFYWLLFGIPVSGWVPIMLILTFTAGAQMTMLGILGEYLWRTLEAVRHRPAYVVDREYGAPARRAAERP